jgi:Family of unknown function (DUF6279)
MLVAALLPACSAVKLAYNQAPDITYWWLDGYFDLNEQQSPKVRDALAKLLAWHRSSELPKVAALLQKTQAAMPGPISSQQTCAVFAELSGMLQAVAERAVPASAELAPTLTATQLAFLQRKYDKTNADYTRDYITSPAAERYAKRLKSAINRSEMVYGKLEAAQTAAIEQAIAASSFDPALGLKERLQRQKEALDMLTSLAATQASPAAAQAALRAYLARTTRSSDPVYRAYADKMVKESCDAFAAVHASTTPAQRAKAVETLKSYAQDALILAGQS